MLHSRRATPTPSWSVPEKVNLIEVDSLLPLFEIVLLLPSTAESIEVVGEVVSTLHVNEAGLKSLFPALSSERTLNVCGPSITLTVLVLTQVTKGIPSRLHSKR